MNEGGSRNIKQHQGFYDVILNQKLDFITWSREKRFKKAFIRRIDILIIRRLILITHLTGHIERKLSSICDIEVEITTPVITTVGEGRVEILLFGSIKNISVMQITQGYEITHFLRTTAYIKIKACS